MANIPPPPGGMPPPPPPPPGVVPPPGYQPYQTYQAGPNYAGFWARVGATILDGLIAIPFLVPAVVAIFAGPRSVQSCTVNGRAALCNVPTGATIAIAALLGLAGFVAYLVIYCRMVGATGQSWGRKAVNIKVVDAMSGQTIGTGRSVGRYFAHIITGLIPCYIGYLWMLWDRQKQTIHDKIVRTVVVQA